MTADRNTGQEAVVDHAAIVRMQLEGTLVGQKGVCRDAALAALSALEQELAEAKEGFRLIAQAAGEDGTDPDAWRAMTSPSPFEYALRSVKQLWEDYNDDTDLRAAEARITEVEAELAVLREGMERQKRGADNAAFHAGAAEAEVRQLRALIPPAPESVPQWGVPDWREWARTTRAAAGSAAAADNTGKEQT